MSRCAGSRRSTRRLRGHRRRSRRRPRSATGAEAFGSRSSSARFSSSSHTISAMPSPSVSSTATTLQAPTCPGMRVREATAALLNVQTSASPFTRLNSKRSSRPSPSKSADPPTCHSSADGRLLRSSVPVASTAPPFKSQSVSAPVEEFSQSRSADRMRGVTSPGTLEDQLCEQVVRKTLRNQTA